MAFIPIPNCVQVEMVYDYLGERCENVFHNIMPIGYDAISINTMLDVYIAWFVAERQPFAVPELSLIELVGTDQASETGPRVVSNAGLPATGAGSAGIAMPGNVTCVASWSTNNRGRSFRGRTYHIGLTETQVTGNVLDPAVTANLTAQYQVLLSDLALNGTPMGVASRYSNGAPRATGIITPIVDVSVNADVDSQRRRLSGRGR